MKKIFLLIVVINILTFSQTPIKVDFLFTGSHFQQQVKQAVGEERGQRLVYEFNVGLHAAGLYKFHENISGGLYFRFDRGWRNLANFDGFDSDGKTKVKDGIGGGYTEFWFGPMLQFNYKFLFFDAGYALIGIRKDGARTDIPSVSGDVEKALNINPKIAFLFSLGAEFPINEKLNINVKIEYRARYYDKRGDEPFLNNIDHGTQGVLPMIGVSYSF